MRKAVWAIGMGLLAASAHAQDISPAFDMTTMSNWTAQGAALEQAKRQAGPRIVRPQPAQAAVNPAQVLARMNYRPDAAVRQRVYARAVAQMQKSGPASVAKYREILTSGKMRNEVASYLASQGMSANNLVDATTIYLAVAWLTTHGNNGAPSAAQLRGLRRQVALAYGTMPALLGASDATKQTLAESNILQASLASSIADQSARDPKLSARARAAIASWVRDSYQLDLMRLTLTSSGLR